MLYYNGYRKFTTINPNRPENNTMKKNLLIFLIVTALFVFIAGGTILFGLYCNRTIGECRQYCYDDLNAVPTYETGLLLGTAKTTPSGKPNLYFSARIDAATALYHAGKIKHILISGDNSRKNYNEPQDMKISLLSRGVPGSAITLDYAGFRTLDSVLRSKNVFQKSSMLIITQPGHAERAIYISRKNDIQASAFLAAEPLQYKWLIERNRKREKLACIAAWLDVNILRRRPKFVK